METKQKRNRIKKQDATINIKVSTSLHEAVKQFAEFNNTTASAIYRQAVIELLNKGKNDPL